MIKILRVDERLVHGQVAFAWTNTLGADSILIVNDAVKNDKLRITSLKLAAPSGIKFVVKSVEEAIPLLNGNKTDKFKLFVIVDNTDDALKLAKNVKKIKCVNLGNMKVKDGTKSITKSIAVSERDITNIKEMIELDVEVECRAVPTDKKVMAKDLI